MSSTYEDCETGLEAITHYIQLLVRERNTALNPNLYEDGVIFPDFFLDEIFAAKIAKMFLTSFDEESQAIKAMEKLNRKYLESEDIYLDFIIEALRDGDYNSLEF